MNENNEFQNERIQSNNDQEVITNDDQNNDSNWFYKTRSIVYYILGVIEVLLLFRIVFKGLNANVSNTFVAAIYSITNLLITPFVGIFNIITANNNFTYVIEPSSIIAMIVYAILAYGLIRLIKVTYVEV